MSQEQSQQQQAEQLRPKVGLGVFIVKDGKVLVGKRKSSHGDGEYSLPGGHLEYMESFADCARREVLEETGIEITDIEHMCTINLTAYAPRHYVAICMRATWLRGEPQVLEPDRTHDWIWCDIDAIPQPHYRALTHYIEAYTTGRTCFDTQSTTSPFENK